MEPLHARASSHLLNISRTRSFFNFAVFAYLHRDAGSAIQASIVASDFSFVAVTAGFLCGSPPSHSHRCFVSIASLYLLVVLNHAWRTPLQRYIQVAGVALGARVRSWIPSWVE